MEILARNTNDLQPYIYSLLRDHGTPDTSRNGPVLRFDEPVTIKLSHPWERVNFCPRRNANPFFHLIESAAILAGRNDIQLLSHFASNMRLYSDDGLTQNAFYGTRLRNTWGDQLVSIISLLQRDPNSRQAVAQIWDANDLMKVTKDKACNLLLMFAIRDGSLVMTSVNRSNDAIWGGVAGANIVHLSFIHEYVTCALGLNMGEWWHFSNNLHVYTDNPLWKLLSDKDYTKMQLLNTIPYQRIRRHSQLFSSPHRIGFDNELSCAMTLMVHAVGAESELEPDYAFDSINDMIVVFNAWQKFKSKAVGSIDINNYLQQMHASDWRVACQAWITRKLQEREIK